LRFKLFIHCISRYLRTFNISGFEIAGLVLGGIPIVMSALEHYMKGLGTLQNSRRYRRICHGIIDPKRGIKIN
jgi:hypothetical protein